MQEQTITQDLLTAAGYERVEYNGGALIEYWRTYKPLWTNKLRQHNCSIRVRFPDDAYYERDFIVWVGISNSLTAAPGVRTMEQLGQLLGLLTDAGQGR